MRSGLPPTTCPQPELHPPRVARAGCSGSCDHTRTQQRQIPLNPVDVVRSLEYFRAPDRVICVSLEKSTCTRCGVTVNITLFGPGWKRFATVEIRTTTALPAKISAAKRSVRAIVRGRRGMRTVSHTAQGQGPATRVHRLGAYAISPHHTARRSQPLKSSSVSAWDLMA
jgi:hypothetical protein